MRHLADPVFWDRLEGLPRDVRTVAERNFQLLKADPRHPSLRFKKVGQYWSVRVSRDYRALAVQQDDDLIWFWIGTHADYDKLLGS